MSESDEARLQLGGMALQNGLAVFGPTAWAATVRLADGTLKTAHGRRPKAHAAINRVPLMRGAIRLGEMVVVLPILRRRLPEARLGFEQAGVAAMAGVCSAATAVLKRRGGVRGELAATALGVVPAVLALRSSSLTGYHGAEHKAIGAYEQGIEATAATKEHDRCGTHLVGPMMASQLGAAALISRLPRSYRAPAQAVGQIAAMGLAVELFAWTDRNRDHAVAKVLGRPGTAFQRAVATTEPSADELEVAETALAALLAAERGT